MKYNKLNSFFYIRNRERLVKRLRAGSVAIINSNDQMPRNGDQFFKYRQNSDLFYFTGIEQEETILLLSKQPDNTTDEFLFILKPNAEKEIWEGKKLTIDEATNLSGIRQVMYQDNFKQKLSGLIKPDTIIYYNSNENKRFKTEVPYRDLRIYQWLEKEYPGNPKEKLAPDIEKLRIIKSTEEIEMMSRACQITKEGFLTVLNKVKPGMYEYEVEAILTGEFLRNGASGHAYEPIVATGKNACVLHYTTNDCILQDSDLLLIDFGAEYGNYAADCTRTIPVNGRFTPRQKQLYNATLDIMKESTRLLVPGTTLNKVQEQVCRLWEKKHIECGLYTNDDLLKQTSENNLVSTYFMHGVSHFIGLDVHDIGSKDQPLEPGMTVTFEPGIYIRSENIGIRLETNLLIQENGAIDLMKDIPVECNEIEQLMKKTL